MNTRLLITGATGNIGLEVLAYLRHQFTEVRVYAAVRNLDKAKTLLSEDTKLDFVKFDFDSPETYDGAFEKVDVLFLLRPPHISDIEKFFRPLLTSAYEAGIRKIVFLSVQGVESSKVIPHNKIERLIKEMNFDYVFLRPSYFMQNLTTTLLPDIKERKTITLPSGSAIFNWVDVTNIGEAAANILCNFDNHKNQAYDITGLENKSFGEITDLMNDTLGTQIKYRSKNPVSFLFMKYRKTSNFGLASVMTLLHFLPRFQQAPVVSNSYTAITNKQPTTLIEFFKREKEKFTPPNNA